MFCTHCGKEINEEKIEKSKSSFEIADGKCDSETKVEYVCPRCQILLLMEWFSIVLVVLF